MYGPEGDCSLFNYCGEAAGQGTCKDNGVCECNKGYVGANCSIELQCSYWDEETYTYSSEGCEIASSNTGFLVCECTHLTDFSALSFPSSLDDLLKSLESMTFNTLSAADLAGVRTARGRSGGGV